MFQDTNQLYHPVSGHCLDSDAAQKEIFMNPCSQNDSQKWIFANLNETEIRTEWKKPLA